jgi:hypothetical protein
MFRLDSDTVSIASYVGTMVDAESWHHIETVTVMTESETLVVVDSDNLHCTFLHDSDSIVAIGMTHGYAQNVKPIAARNMLITLQRRIVDAIGTTIDFNSITDYETLTIID